MTVCVITSNLGTRVKHRLDPIRQSVKSTETYGFNCPFYHINTLSRHYVVIIVAITIKQKYFLKYCDTLS